MSAAENILDQLEETEEEQCGLSIIPDEPIPFLRPTSEEGVYELLVDNSSKELFETCSRAQFYYTVMRREGIAERPSLFRGTVIHGALARRMLGVSEADQLRYIMDAYKDKDFGPDEWRTCERAVETIQLYNKQWPAETEPFDLVVEDRNGRVAVEVPFKLYLGEAHLDSWVETHAGRFFVKKVLVYWTGIIDAVISYSGILLVMDHKTTSVLGTTFFDDFVLSSQMHGYVWAARKLGWDCKGLFLDVLAGRKPTRTGIANEFQRQRYFYSEEHLAEWERDTFTLITDFLEHLCRGYFPKSPKWCFGKYGRCQYWDVCSQLPQNRKQMLDSELFKNVTWDPTGTPTI